MRLAEEWRGRVIEICREVAATHGARLADIESGLQLAYAPRFDAYALLLVWPESPDECLIELDAEELSVADESAREALRARIEERTEYAVRRYFAARSERWRPADA
jgi:hypothetical protein